jgi:hypothetical protein
MADFVITPANVLASAQAQITTGTTGATVTITAGQSLAVQADGKMGLYKANGAAPLNVFAGIALHGSLAGQPIVYVKSDPSFQPGATFTAIGDAVLGSGNTSGGICPDADKATGWFVTELGRTTSLTLMKLQPVVTGVAR